MITTKTLREEYLSFVNDYLTLETFAEHRSITKEQAKSIVEMGKFHHEEYVAMLKS